MTVEHDVTEPAGMAAEMVSDEFGGGDGGGRFCGWVWIFWVLTGCWPS